MMVYNETIKALDTEIFPQYTIADLNLCHYINCFVQSGETYTVRGNKHIHTNTHTHTHTHTHTRTITPIFGKSNILVGIVFSSS